MATINTSVSVLDRVDGQPAIILPNQNFAVWSTELNKYIDTGAKATPEDDVNAVKYFKLTATSQTPSAPTEKGGWKTIAELDSALKAAGWSTDPLSVSDKQRFHWIAVYGRENIAKPNAESGVVEFEARYTFSKTALYNNYAASPTISVDEDTHTITITNPDGTKVETEFATTDGVEALTEIVKGLQKQVDKAIYSYDGDGKPSLTSMPVTDWIKGSDGKPITDDKVKGEIFATHIGDLYYDRKDGLSYKFTLKEGGNPATPGDYQWELLSDSAATEALKQVAELEGDTVKIWTEQPKKGDSYKVGDLWLYKDAATGQWRYKHCIKTNTPPEYAFDATDWVEPYATLKDVADLRAKLQTISGDLATAKGNIDDLQKETKEIKGEWIEGIKDGIITEQERADLQDTSRRIDEEQAQLQSNVDYILASPYFEGQDAFSVKADAVLAKTSGSIDKLQDAITKAVDDATITEQERSDVDSAFAVYHTTRETLLAAIKDAKAEIDKRLREAGTVTKTVTLSGKDLDPDTYYPLAIWGTSMDGRAHRYEVARPLLKSFGVPHWAKHKEGFQCNLTWTQVNSSWGSYVATREVLRADVTSTVDGISPFSQPDHIIEYSVSYVYLRGGSDYTLTLEAPTQEKLDNIKWELIQTERSWGSDPYIRTLKPTKEITPAITDLEAERQAREEEIAEINANPPRINAKGNWEVYRFKDGEGAYEDTGRTAKGDSGKAPEIRDGYWYEWDGSKYTNTGIKARGEDGKPGKDGKDGQGGLVCTLNRQGSFHTTYRTVGSSGEVLAQPTAVKTVEGGVGGKVVVTATIRKGVKDVTESAKSKGGNFRWLLNGTQIASGTATLSLGPGDHVDGKTDEITFTFDDSRSAEW